MKTATITVVKAVIRAYPQAVVTEDNDGNTPEDLAVKATPVNTGSLAKADLLKKCATKLVNNDFDGLTKLLEVPTATKAKSHRATAERVRDPATCDTAALLLEIKQLEEQKARYSKALEAAQATRDTLSLEVARLKASANVD